MVRAMRTCPICKELKETKYLSNTLHKKHGDNICRSCLKKIRAKEAKGNTEA